MKKKLLFIIGGCAITALCFIAISNKNKTKKL